MGRVTGQERREVARRLRDEADYPGYAVQYMEQFIGDLRQALFGDLNPTADYSEMFTRLADLIEPSGHECVPGECPINVRHDNDRIDRDALLAFADEMSDYTWYETEGDHRIAEGFARRIREALGATGGGRRGPAARPAPAVDSRCGAGASRPREPGTRATGGRRP